ncbi:E3 ubiquitin-protein ligase TRIM50-like isoform X1 [Brienomyrus brachyistius]|uniref:E3 ubiquitin-protein ligase TRIM50-like isoform X1 n=1 Tax=Brienomyrus brachyistius TaxID=42636 RepID=UPI0020B44151|nr:E3 ubiquitin-protein ligase TRIM50-like isoform X1 [Brienomyrus brachyistius]XP_048836396.1 E3 ubiquitin-protein ligase TRIM50-like isoform X1 [Brienomyrus brachyistius]
MARRPSLVSLEEQLRCPVCLEMFTEPLMLQCGHSYCRGCVRSMSVDQFGQLQCPVCRSDVDADSPPLNVSLARIVEHLQEASGAAAAAEGEGEPETCAEHHNPLSLYCEEDRTVICGLCGSIGVHRTHKITPIGSVYSHMKEDISSLMTQLQTQRKKLEEQICKMVNNKSRITNESDVLKWVIRKEFGELRHHLEQEEASFMHRAESTAAALVAGVQRRVEDMTQVLAKFQKAEEVLEGLSNESHLGFITKYGSIAPRIRECQLNEWREERAYTSVTFKPGFHHDDIKISVWKRLHRKVLPAPESLKLDPLTAHPMLRLSHDYRAVECGALPAQMPNNLERFRYSYCVLASRGFSSGKHYWEVGVGAKPKWRLGLVKGTICRKGKLPKSPENGVWLIGLKEGRLYEAFASPRVGLPLGAQPAKIGVYLDYEKGELAFYNADSPQELTFIYKFQADLQGKVYPLFDVCWHERGVNKHPLTLPQPQATK